MVVVNISHLETLGPDDVYIGRPSKWGNPFVSGKDGERDEVIEMYKNYILANIELLVQVEELRDKNLVCHCKPLACHGDVLQKILDDTNTLMKAFK